MCYQLLEPAMEPNELGHHGQKHVFYVCIKYEPGCVSNIGPAVTVTHLLVRVHGSSIILPYLYVKGDHFSQLPTHRDIMKYT